MKHLILIIIALAAIFLTFVFIDPVPQDPAYHHFKDTRKIFLIPNAFDVLSNLPFIIIGLVGIIKSLNLRNHPALKISVLHYLVFFSGVFLTGFGSAYYHLAPSNQTLVWDRLPISILTIGFFCSVVSEVVNPKVAKIIVGPLLVAGIGSVLYWIVTEMAGNGDLRFYGVVQFLPVILVPLMLLMYKLPDDYLQYVVGLLFFYGLSRAAEAIDHGIFETLNVISGHSLKHLFAAAATLCILIMLQKRSALYK